MLCSIRRNGAGPAVNELEARLVEWNRRIGLVILHVILYFQGAPDTEFGGIWHLLNPVRITVLDSRLPGFRGARSLHPSL